MKRPHPIDRFDACMNRFYDWTYRTPSAWPIRFLNRCFEILKRIVLGLPR